MTNREAVDRLIKALESLAIPLTQLPHVSTIVEHARPSYSSYSEPEVTVPCISLRLGNAAC